MEPTAAAALSPMFGSMLTNLLREVLQANLDGHPSSSSHLPATFCSALLQEDSSRLCGLPQQACDYDQSVEEGVPLYPLYQQLAKSLQVWISTGLLPRSLPDSAGLAEQRTCNARIEGWNRRVVELGSTLLKLLHSAKFQVNVQEPYYSLLKGVPLGNIFMGGSDNQRERLYLTYLCTAQEGTKTVEGRCNSGCYKRIKAGDFLLFNQCLLLEVTAVRLYPAFQAMLEAEGVSKVLPGVLAIAEGVQVYRRFYSEADELTHGALALHVSGSSVLNQPHRVMEMLLSELNVEGMRLVLGLRRTAGSNLDLLPPPRSTLLSSFSKLVEDTTPVSQAESKKVKSRLTVGARALAKHASRSSSGWWGVFTGTEALKNEQALSVVCNLLDNATWINVHHIPPAFPTFEIRVTEGYGSRWSADGEEFRGFLEPPMEQGHEKKWRH